jgi:hypothetical protein
MDMVSDGTNDWDFPVIIFFRTSSLVVSVALVFCKIQDDSLKNRPMGANIEPGTLDDASRAFARLGDNGFFIKS